MQVYCITRDATTPLEVVRPTSNDQSPGRRSKEVGCTVPVCTRDAGAGAGAGAEIRNATDNLSCREPRMIFRERNHQPLTWSGRRAWKRGSHRAPGRHGQIPRESLISSGRQRIRSTLHTTPACPLQPSDPAAGRPKTRLILAHFGSINRIPSANLSTHQVTDRRLCALIPDKNAPCPLFRTGKGPVPHATCHWHSAY